MVAADSNLLSPPLTASTKNFRESVHLIPSIKQEERPKNYEPAQLNIWLLAFASLLMVGLGIGLEVALHISNKDQGFSVKEQNVFGKFASPDFLTHFVPIVLVAPLVLLWESKNQAVKRYQPYIVMSRQNASADDSILLDYSSSNALFVPILAWRKRHWLVFCTSLAGLATLLLQPLAGSIFNIGQFNMNQTASATSTRSLGLDPDRFQLTAFFAAAGYVLAAVENGLGDPPFVHNNWAAADFAAPVGEYLNGTLILNTVGVRTNATCSAPASLRLTQITRSNFSISATSASNFSTQGSSCSVTSTFDPAAASQNQQYGVTNVQNCGPHANGNVTFQPVFFWFYSGSSSGQQGAGVFCNPTLEVFNIQAESTLSNNSLGNVTILSPFTDQNNVTGSPQNGLPFNGVIFDSPADNFTQARASATQTGVPGAIIRSVTTNATLAPNAFNSLDGFVDTTSRIYTQHLALIAKNTYMLQHNSTQQAILTSQKPRLVIQNGPAHALAVLLIIMGIILLAIGTIHKQIRKSFILTHHPGTIANSIALTSHSGFGMFLYPYDTDATIATKLAPLRFRLDKRTGAIVADDAPGYDFARGENDRGRESDSEEEYNDAMRKAAGYTDVNGGYTEKPPMNRAPTSGLTMVNSTYSGPREQPETMMALLGGTGSGSGSGSGHVRDDDGGSGRTRDSVSRPLNEAGYRIEPFSPPARD